MWTSLPIVSLLALATSVAAQGGDVLFGGACPYDGWLHCQDQGAWGCVQLAGPNCVNQTPNCDNQCSQYLGFRGGPIYAYQKDNSNDPRCVCSFDDANQPQGRFHQRNW